MTSKKSKSGVAKPGISYASMLTETTLKVLTASGIASNAFVEL